MENALEVKNLTKEYAGFKLDNVNISLPSGCIMGFIGENGAGKTTTIKLILDLINRDSGEISILGDSLPSGGNRIKEHIGVVMDESGVPDTLTVKNIGNIMGSIFKTWDKRRFEDYVKRFALPEKKKVSQFSRGMKMKLSIAVALSHDSRILILDEATSGLDPIVREEILDIFLDFIQDEGHSIFISSHIISDLEKICDYITFIHKGKIMFSEEKDALLEKYAIVKCSEEQYRELPPSQIIGARKSRFSSEALMERRHVPSGLTFDRAGIEDIMLYYVKEAAI